MSKLPEANYKIVVVGSSGVGKTSIVQRLVDGIYSEEKQSTVGVEFKTFTITTDSEVAKFSIWDTAGQERFRSVSKAYFRGAAGGILTFALDNQQSFQELDGWLNDLQSLATPNAVILLIGNKLDCNEGRQITTQEAMDYAQRHGLEYLETSAKDGTNVNEAFVRLAKTLHENVKSGKLVGAFQPPTAPHIATADKKADSGCNC
ncbi:Ras family protein [Trichomonas vaginalis G3]|uniref:Ras family protein n=1 Tax=Trichomonas vaginalis (strain ATCC PRA-98 / G3) TaxID=412133 RepID=A2DQG8_TRIV3|nr:regulation of endocytosis [Trichomonas vaginalis G3]EAY17425.1 Ras family protein [Trichomonas vaginalis G3]KAI5491437.1 regulation of endocytosis [Trichomonas vaginalis G3]|eukprot:XP_001330794.1 Ras family protein [Trichomonas vaginalis G3]